MSTVHEAEWTEEAVSRFWDYQSERPSIADIYFSALHGSTIARRTRRWIPKGAARVLDMGCGTGVFLTHLATARPGMSLAGADFSTDSIRVAAQACKSVLPKPDLKAISGYPTPWGDETFDAIYSIEVVEHHSDPMLKAVLDECTRLLKPKGFLIITTPNDEDLERQHTCCPECGATFHIWQHMRRWTAASLAAKLSEHGLQPIRVKETFLEPLHVRVLLWIARMLRVSRRRPPNLVGIFQRPQHQISPRRSATV